MRAEIFARLGRLYIKQSLPSLTRAAVALFVAELELARSKPVKFDPRG